MNFPVTSVRDTLRTVYKQVDTLRGEFAEGVAQLGVQEERLPTLLGCMYHVTGTTQNW